MVILGCALALALCGCVTHTSQPQHLGGYAVGDKYRIEVPLALVKSDDGRIIKIDALTTIGRRRSPCASMLFGVSSELVAQWCGDSRTCSANDEDLQGTVPAGTILKITRIDLKKGWNILIGKFNDDMRVYGVIEPAFSSRVRQLEVTDLSVFVNYPDARVLLAPDLLLLNPMRAHESKGAGRSASGQCQRDPDTSRQQ
jgi:hypothetical protein